MKKSHITLTVIFALVMSLISTAFAKEFPVYTVFASSIPAVGPGQVILQTHEYLACLDPVRRQPVWVAYHVEKSDHDTHNVLSRNFTTPRQFADISLESSDYRGNGWADQGHMVALAHKSASRHAFEVNWMPVIAIQSKELNRGPWLDLENWVRELAEEGEVEVITGCLFKGEKRNLPHADEPHEAPSHCWMWIKSETEEAAFLIPQDCERNHSVDDYEIDVEQLKGKVSPVWWSSAD